MGKRVDFIIRKATFSIVTLISVLIFNFFLFRILPGDPVQMLINPRMRPETKERLRHDFGLDKPVWWNIGKVKETGNPLSCFDSQFFTYVSNLLRGDIGLSFRQKEPVINLIKSHLFPTVLLLFSGVTLGVIIGTSMGLIAAWKKGTYIDSIVMVVGLTIWSLPPFWMGLMLLILSKGYFPSGGFMTAGATFAGAVDKWKDIASHLVLPASTLALFILGGYMLIARNATLEVLAEDYVLTAKAKGLHPLRVLISHVLRNVSLPLVTLIALDIGIAMGGTIQIETIFSWPGIGRLMFNSIAQRDYPVLQGVFLLLAASVIAVNFLADVLYALLDPRVRLGS